MPIVLQAIQEYPRCTPQNKNRIGSENLMRNGH